MLMYKLECFAHRKLIKVLPICRGFEGPCFNKGKLRRQGSAYVNDKLNWAFLCDDCQKLSHKYWDGMWNEYYSQVM